MFAFRMDWERPCYAQHIVMHTTYVVNTLWLFNTAMENHHF